MYRCYKLTGPQLVKKFPAFYGTRGFITLFRSACHLSLSWASSIQSITSHPASWRSILILSSRLRLGLPSGLFLSDFPTKTLYTPLLSPPYAPRAPPIFQKFKDWDKQNFACCFVWVWNLVRTVINKQNWLLMLDRPTRLYWWPNTFRSGWVIMNSQGSRHFEEQTERAKVEMYLVSRLLSQKAQNIELLSTNLKEWLKNTEYCISWTVRGLNPDGGGRDFPHPSRPALEPTQPPILRVPCLSQW